MELDIFFAAWYTRPSYIAVLALAAVVVIATVSSLIVNSLGTSRISESLDSQVLEQIEEVVFSDITLADVDAYVFLTGGLVDGEVAVGQTVIAFRGWAASDPLAVIVRYDNDTGETSYEFAESATVSGLSDMVVSEDYFAVFQAYGSSPVFVENATPISQGDVFMMTERQVFQKSMRENDLRIRRGEIEARAPIPILFADKDNEPPTPKQQSASNIRKRLLEGNEHSARVAEQRTEDYVLIDIPLPPVDVSAFANFIGYDAGNSRGAVLSVDVHNEHTGQLSVDVKFFIMTVVSQLLKNTTIGET